MVKSSDSIATKAESGTAPAQQIFQLNPSSPEEVKNNNLLLQKFVESTNSQLAVLQNQSSHALAVAEKSLSLVAHLQKESSALRAEVVELQQLTVDLQQQLLSKGTKMEGGVAALSPFSSNWKVEEGISKEAEKFFKLPPLPSYNGKSDPELWIRQVEDSMKALGVSPDHYVNILPKLVLQLDGGALEWWFSSWGRPDAPHLEDWSVFRQDFLRAFGNPIKALEAREKLSSMKHQSSVQNYVAYFRSLVRQIPDLADSEAYHSFKRNLKPFIRKKIYEHEAVLGKELDLDTLISFALTVEKIHQDSNSNPSPPAGPGPGKDRSGVRCHKCGQLGHLARNCKSSKASPEGH